ncbi:hypothetical protein HanXRQr2_Chr05g0233081 [Helianthus annuus]|uniref:Uncharacterized protein n=1 Tax=Helianthus annuus TaxID=4232 RepID=A0A9K3J2X8_HELAN|nr:hypothetical protein HanXRQr2_Chr05g0233081 [Helianthus annuus]KAJ0924141.1 hypothetical protein HanPSC8_Chr05g0224831 [Helianthus annuus]
MKVFRQLKTVSCTKLFLCFGYSSGNWKLLAAPNFFCASDMSSTASSSSLSHSLSLGVRGVEGSFTLLDGWFPVASMLT